MTLSKQIQIIVEQLPETEQKLIYELIKRISPDDVLSSDDMDDIIEARAEYSRGETVTADKINW